MTKYIIIDEEELDTRTRDNLLLFLVKNNIEHERSDYL
jgi:hypothetical protein